LAWVATDGGASHHRTALAFFADRVPTVRMDTPASHPEVESIAADIASMEIRGAATIADAAATALRTQAESSDATDPDEFKRELRAAARILLDTRPTAVSLPNSLRFVLERMDGSTVEELRTSTIAAAREFCLRLETAQDDLGAIGANRLRDGDTVMLHCHSTDALACIEAAHDQGKDLSAIVKETRPRKQGHITASQLRERDIPVTLIVDGAAGKYLDDADHVFVGADSIAADGSVINKIGTRSLAVTARERDTPIVVAAQTVKLDPATLSGHTVDIEYRDESEVISQEDRADIGDIDVKNPAFDITPPRYVDAIVTERGQFPPESIVTLMRELFGEQSGTPWEEPTDEAS
jgi:ribose 1,5-bisphosphate isomerase